jgi:hypothetical protein
MDIVKVDRDIAYAAIAIHHMLQTFIPNISSVFFQTYVVGVFIRMLHIFHTYIVSVLSECCIYFAMTFQVFLSSFASVSDACFKCFICFQV